MKIEDLRKKIEALSSLVEISTLMPEEIEKQNKIQRAYDAQYDW